MGEQALINLRWSQALIDGLVSRGLSQVVISPGSRSTPLALVCERHPAIQTWVQIDERSAAFFALGMAKARLQPVGLIATSGSAPAHWYPAVIEASQSAIPLLLLSADRPPELQNCGANQTIDQVNLFGSHVRHFHQLPVPVSNSEQLDAIHQLGQQATEESLFPLPGPVHLNIPFREPLVPDDSEVPISKSQTVESITPFTPPPDAVQLAQLATDLGGKQGIIICGPEQFADGFAEAVTILARRLGAPILADPLSNLRFGPHDQQHIISHYEAFLKRTSFTHNHAPDWVLRFGAMPVSKALAIYIESHEESLHYLIDGNARLRDPLHRIIDPIAADPTLFCLQLATQLPDTDNSKWLEGFKQEEQRAAQLVNTQGSIEATIIGQCIEALPEHSILFSSNSMSIRDLDSYSGNSNKNLRIKANRGVSGIDGNLSTLLGIAAANSDKPGLTLGLIGDLAFFHDMNGLLMARGLDAIIILINNNGGAIFQHLPQAGLPEFERIWMTPTNLDFSRVAALYNLEYQRVTTTGEFDAALDKALQQSGVRIIEVIIDAQVSHDEHHRYWNAVAAE